MEDSFLFVGQVQDLLCKDPNQKGIRKVKTRLKRISDDNDKIYVLTSIWHALQKSTFVSCHRFIQFGHLYAPVKCLSSENNHTRAIAYSVLQRFYCYMESATDFMGKDFWLGFIDNIRMSIKTTNEQIPSIVASFLSHAIEVLIESCHPLKEALRSTVINYQKSNDVWRCIKSLLHSSDPLLQSIQNNWSLRIIHESCSNCKKEELNELFNQGIIDSLIRMLSSCCSSNETKVLCLEIIEICSRDEHVAKKLCYDHSIHSFLLLLAIDFSSKGTKIASKQLIDGVNKVSKNIQQILDFDNVTARDKTSHPTASDGQEPEMKFRASRKRPNHEIDNSKLRQVNDVSIVAPFFRRVSTLLECKRIKKE